MPQKNRSAGRSMTQDFLYALAHDRPVPGGGAAAAHAAVVALALLQKIVRVEMERPWLNPEAKGARADLLERTIALSRNLLALRESDGKAYLAWTEARRNGPASEAAQAALLAAAASPRAIMETVYEAYEIVRQCAAFARRHLIPDVLVAAEILEAAFRGAAHIARANLDRLSGPKLGEELQQQSVHLDRLVSRFEEIRRHTRFLTADRISPPEQVGR